MSTVLVIDSHEPVRCLIRHMLEPVGYEVTEAATPSEALSLARTRVVDVIMMDLIEPVRAGLDAIGAIRQSFPQSKIIAMTGEAIPTLEVIEVSRLFGAHATLLKPFTPHTLFKILSSLWRHRTAA